MLIPPSRPSPDALDRLIERLRGLTLRPGFLDNHAPSGVLANNGLAMWEMPATAAGGGYSNWMRQVFSSLSSAQYFQALRASARNPTTKADFPSDQEFVNSYQDSIALPHASLDTNDLGNGVYNVGKSMFMQNLIFAARSTGPRTWDFHQYAEVAPIVAAARANGISTVYGQIGQGGPYGVALAPKLGIAPALLMTLFED